MMTLHRSLLICLKKILSEYIKNILNFRRRRNTQKSDEVCFQAPTECHICGNELGKDRVRDHCHLTGKFREAAHES